jgi:hypothetical protein
VISITGFHRVICAFTLSLTEPTAHSAIALTLHETASAVESTQRKLNFQYVMLNLSPNSKTYSKQF